jgi:hypothetical protein
MPPEPAADAAPAFKWRGSFGQRLAQYALLFGAITPLKVLRATVPSFVPLAGLSYVLSTGSQG